MKAVLISIQPKWCELIASGKKTVEVRKTKPKLKTPFKVYIYCTNSKPILGRCLKDGSLKETPGDDFDNYNRDTLFKANGKVIGEFVCDDIECFTTDYRANIEQTERISEQSCVGYGKLMEYETNSPCLYGWHISDLVIYDKPKELSEFFVYCDRCDQRPIACKFAYEESNENGYYSECMCDFKRPIERPPQSWCYVERLGDAE